jgi:hypothetical protein
MQRGAYRRCRLCVHKKRVQDEGEGARDERRPYLGQLALKHSSNYSGVISSIPPYLEGAGVVDEELGVAGLLTHSP